MLNNPLIEPLVRAALIEDLGAGGRDVTSEATIPADKKATALLRARAAGVVAGADVTAAAFRLTDPSLKIKQKVNNGDKVSKNDIIIEVSGSARAIMVAERVALNYLSHLSGVATLTNRYIVAIKGTKAKITDTRKTIPGLRALQKAAVLAGGGCNHRFSLSDAILIKDNHIAVAGGIKPALTQARTAAPHTARIEIEVDNLKQLQQVLDHGGADIVMLDNMDIATLKKAVAMVGGRLITEASGGVTLETVRAIAETGVDYISIGALTHSAPALDLGLDIDL